VTGQLSSTYRDWQKNSPTLIRRPPTGGGTAPNYTTEPLPASPKLSRPELGLHFCNQIKEE